MDTGLFVSLLLAGGFGLFTVLALIWEKAKDGKGRLGWFVWFSLIAAVFGSVLTVWQLMEDRNEDVVQRDRFQMTLDRTNTIIDSLTKANEMHRVALEQQQWIADTTCASIGVSIDKLDGHTVVLTGLTSQITDQLQKAEKIHRLTREQNYRTDDLRLTAVFRLSIPITQAGFRGETYSSALIELDSVMLDSITSTGTSLLDTCLMLLARIGGSVLKIMDLSEEGKFLSTMNCSVKDPMPMDILTSAEDTTLHVRVRFEYRVHHDEGWLDGEHLRLLDELGLHGASIGLGGRNAREELKAVIGSIEARGIELEVTNLSMANSVGYTFDWVENPVALHFTRGGLMFCALGLLPPVTKEDRMHLFKPE